MLNNIKKLIDISCVTLITLVAFVSCQTFENKKLAAEIATPKSATSPFVFQADELPALSSTFSPVQTKRKVAADSKNVAIKCDLESDRCSGKALTDAQTTKTLFLTDLVADKLLEIEKTEKLAGRDFKVALIGRMGSNLKKFQPLKDKDVNGKTMSVSTLVEQLISQSQNIHSDSPPAVGAIDPQVMQEFFDRSKKLKYSHLGIAVKNMVLKDKNGRVVTKSQDGHWAVVHLLYSCEDQKQSYVFKGTLSHFFYDHMADYGAQIIVPESNLQNNIENILVKDYIGKNWVEKQYNAIALADDLNQQNSNQWVLEVLAAALYPSGKIKDRAEAQAVLQKTNYHETKVTPTGLYSALTVPFVSKLVSNIMPTVCMQYQPTIRKYGIGEIITALSLEEYLIHNNRIAFKYDIELIKEDIEAIDKNLSPKKQEQQTFNN